MPVSKGAFSIPSLDGLRAVSIALVFAGHAGLGHVIPGGFGVTVFFFLSGYLITTLMRREYAKTQHVSLKKFYIRRALRILPPFYLVLILATLLTLLGVLGGYIDPKAVAAQSFYYANYWMVRHGAAGLAPGTGVYWSLAVEEHFYLLFPFLFLAMQRLRASALTQARILLLLCAVTLAWRCVLIYVLRAPSDRTYLASDTRFDSMLFGCMLAVYGNPALDSTRFGERVWKLVLLPLGLAGLLTSFLVRDGAFRETLRYSLQGVSLIPVFVCAVRYPDWGPMKVLNYRPLVVVGVLSYSLYLMHQIVIYAVLESTFGRSAPVLATLICVPVSLALAQLMHVAVEKPCARLRGRFSV